LRRVGVFDDFVANMIKLVDTCDQGDDMAVTGKRLVRASV
jgi:hypothetical protein